MPQRTVLPRPPCLSADWQPEASPSSIDDGLVHIAFFDDRHQPNVRGMLRAAHRANGSHVRFHAILSRPIQVPGMRVTLLRLPTLAQCLYDGLRAISHGPGPHYLAKPLLHLLLPHAVQRLILLDTDVVVLRDLRDVLAEWHRDAPESVVGIADEQSRYYQKGSGGRLVGKNGGVQLLNLEAMRASGEYMRSLDRYASGSDGRWIGWLGDQTLYTFLSSDRPALVYRMGCEWNRQLNTLFGWDPSLHHCPRRCGIIHANNANTIRCVASMMQRDPSCRRWRAFQRALVAPGPGDTNRSCVHLSQRKAAEFGHAIGRFFGDCCVPDA